jgi:hypothetical protein
MPAIVVGCGGRNCTGDLMVMSHSSYYSSTPRKLYANGGYIASMIESRDVSF